MSPLDIASIKLEVKSEDRAAAFILGEAAKGL
jgi:hypothetical protein